MGNMLKIADIVEKTGVATTTVYKWIKEKNLPAIEVGAGRNHCYMVKEEDFLTFQQSSNYYGKPEKIISSEPFTRVPDISLCYPVNLIRAVMELKLDDEDSYDMPDDVFEINIPLFKTFITKLNDQEQRVIMMRYQLGMTLDEIGRAFERSKERIRQIEIRALRRLRKKIYLESPYIMPKRDYDELVQENIALKRQLDVLTEQLKKSEDNEPEEEEESASLDPIIRYHYTPIEDLELSIRSYNCLKRKGINTLGDIFKYDRNQNVFSIEGGKRRYYNTWQCVRNFGRKSLEEVAMQVFALTGYRLHIFNPSEEKFVAYADISGVPQTMTKLEEVES